jgi:hypothetical protein
LQAGDQKRMKTEHQVTMYQGFIDLLQQNPGKSLDELEDLVWKATSLHRLQQSLQNGSHHQGLFEHTTMHPNIAQLCAIMRIKLLLREMGIADCIEGKKKLGIVDQYLQKRT